jgi:hypothetical protein
MADTTSSFLDPASRPCLAKTRSAVLNVLVAVGFTIAVSGWLLRARPGPAERSQLTHAIHLGLMAALLILGATSFVSRRLMGRRSWLRDPMRRERRFFWSHVLPALFAALATPLGLAYGWFVAPQLELVIPFWVIPLALGFLALPRAAELADFDRPMPHPGQASQ